MIGITGHGKFFRLFLCTSHISSISQLHTGVNLSDQRVDAGAKIPHLRAVSGLAFQLVRRLFLASSAAPRISVSACLNSAILPVWVTVEYALCNIAISSARSANAGRLEHNRDVVNMASKVLRIAPFLILSSKNTVNRVTRWPPDIPYPTCFKPQRHWLRRFTQVNNLAVRRVGLLVSPR